MFDLKIQRLSNPANYWLHVKECGRPLGRVLLYTNYSPDTWRIWGLQVDTPGQGDGTAMMCLIVALAEWNNKAIALEPKPLEEGVGLPYDALVHWYRTWGWRGRVPNLLRHPARVNSISGNDGYWIVIQDTQHSRPLSYFAISDEEKTRRILRLLLAAKSQGLFPQPAFMDIRMFKAGLYVQSVFRRTQPQDGRAYLTYFDGTYYDGGNLNG